MIEQPTSYGEDTNGNLPWEVLDSENQQLKVDERILTDILRLSISPHNFTSSPFSEFQEDQEFTEMVDTLLNYNFHDFAPVALRIMEVDPVLPSVLKLFLFLPSVLKLFFILFPFFQIHPKIPKSQLFFYFRYMPS